MVQRTITRFALFQVSRLYVVVLYVSFLYPVQALPNIGNDPSLPVRAVMIGLLATLGQLSQLKVSLDCHVSF